MGFEKKLQQLMSSAESAGSKAMQREVKSLARQLQASLHQELWMTAGGWNDRKLLGAIRDAADAAVVLDAREFVNEKVFVQQNGYVYDIPIPREFRDRQAAIHAAFDGGNVSERGFVYVAWRASPEGYFYVGKAGTRGRMQLDRHGNLASALERASMLSLVFPGASTKANLIGLEASIIELIRSHCGSIPKMNTRIPGIPRSSASDMYNQLGFFLGWVGGQVEDHTS